MERILVREGAGAFSNTFEDLWGMEQLPGLASQRLMEKGYGYGAEGDWKTAAMTHIVKAMTQGLDGGSTFMEDYTYHFEPGNEYVLGAHMLEVCPTIAAGKAAHRGASAGHRRQGRARQAGVRGTRGRRDHDLAGRHGRQAPPDRAGRRVRETHLRDAEPARRAGDVAAEGRVSSRASVNGSSRAERITRCSPTPRARRCWRTGRTIMGIEFVHLTAETRADELKTRLALSDMLWRLRSL